MIKMKDVLIASRNPGKIAEIQSGLAKLGITTQTLDGVNFTGDLPETGATYAANATQKAQFVHATTKGWVLADDSGLEVNALGGAPGVYSRRYSEDQTDQGNRAKLLRELKGVPEGQRGAVLRGVFVLVSPSGRVRVFSASCKGIIAVAEAGSGGHGYDRVFIPEGAVRTLAEMTQKDRERFSFRRQLVCDTCIWLQQLYLASVATWGYTLLPYL